MNREDIKELLWRAGKDAGWVSENCHVDRRLFADWLEGRAIIGELKINVRCQWPDEDTGEEEVPIVEFPLKQYLEIIADGKEQGLDERDSMGAFFVMVVCDYLKEEAAEPPRMKRKGTSSDRTGTAPPDPAASVTGLCRSSESSGPLHA